jgi:hypothetical protein
MSTMTLAFRTSSAPALARRGRDHELLSFVGRQGIVAMPHVMAALGVGQTAAYDRVAVLIEAGLLERIDLVRGEPSLLRATRAGLRYAGLGLAPAVVSPGAIDHWLRCATAAQILAARFGAHRILTERELAFAERHERRPLASAKLGELPNGRPRLHRPDLVVLPEAHPLVRRHIYGGGEDDEAPPNCSGSSRREAALPGPASDRRIGTDLAAHARTREQAREISGDHQRAPAGAEDMGVVVYEVELTPKSPKRLREIIRGWRRASWVAEVRYLCEPGQTRTAVERAVEKLHAQDRIRIDDAPGRVRESGGR